MAERTICQMVDPRQFANVQLLAGFRREGGFGSGLAEEVYQIRNRFLGVQSYQGLGRMIVGRRPGISETVYEDFTKLFPRPILQSNDGGLAHLRRQIEQGSLSQSNSGLPTGIPSQHLN